MRWPFQKKMKIVEDGQILAWWNEKEKYVEMQVGQEFRLRFNAAAWMMFVNNLALQTSVWAHHWEQEAQEFKESSEINSNFMSKKEWRL